MKLKIIIKIRWLSLSSRFLSLFLVLIFLRFFFYKYNIYIIYNK